jgi:L-asparaginase
VKKILIINTGGTFNKVYNPTSGELEIDERGVALKQIAQAWVTKFKIVNIVGKDSLDMTTKDREKIVKTIRKHPKYSRIIVVHGTDTMDITAKYLDDANLNRKIVLTGAMKPFSINPIEATANLASAYGYILRLKENSIFIAMNGKIDFYKRVIKNRGKGYFEITLLNA